VHFLGWRNDVIALMERMDVVTCVGNPALFVETFGRTLVEAMACSKPVVSLARGGPREIVLDGVTGTLFEDYTPASLAEAVFRLSGEAERMRQMGRAGRRRVENLFTVERYVEGVQDCLERILLGSKD